MQVHVNGECIGCGMCASVCPNEFFMTDPPTTPPNTPKDAPNHTDQVQAAADGCPVSAIEVR